MFQNQEQTAHRANLEAALEVGLVGSIWVAGMELCAKSCCRSTVLHVCSFVVFQMKEHGTPQKFEQPKGGNLLDLVHFRNRDACCV